MPRQARWGWRGAGKACPRRIYRFVEPCLLLLLHQGPAHGYQLMERLREFGFDDVPIDSSVVYRALRTMEGEDLVVSSWDTSSTTGPPRRVYQLTETGDSVLTSWVDDLQETVGLLRSFLNTYEQHMSEGEGAYHR